MNRSEFELDLAVDPDALDVAAGEQGELYFKWAERATIAAERCDRAKLRMDTVESELSAQARLDPDQFGIGRVTETAVANAVRVHPEYEEAQSAYIKSKRNAALLKNAVAALDQRKRMIELLVTLHGQAYFAGPSVPRNLAAAWADRRKQREEVANERTGKRARKLTTKRTKS